MSILDIFKPEIETHDTAAWDIQLIQNGLKCTHRSGKYTEYFEAAELAGVEAFEDKPGLTPLQVFQRMMEKTPFTSGFVYKYWDIVLYEKKGCIIRPRLSNNIKDIDNYSDYIWDERYRTNESLRETGMIDFLKYVGETRVKENNEQPEREPD